MRAKAWPYNSKVTKEQIRRKIFHVNNFKKPKTVNFSPQFSDKLAYEENADVPSDLEVLALQLEGSEMVMNFSTLLVEKHIESTATNILINFDNVLGKCEH